MYCGAWKSVGLMCQQTFTCEKLKRTKGACTESGDACEPLPHNMMMVCHLCKNVYHKPPVDPDKPKHRITSTRGYYDEEEHIQYETSYEI